MQESYKWMNDNKFYKMLSRCGLTNRDMMTLFNLKRIPDLKIHLEDPKRWTVYEVEKFTWVCRQCKPYADLRLSDVWQLIDFGKPFKDMSIAEQNVFLANEIWRKGNAM